MPQKVNTNNKLQERRRFDRTPTVVRVELSHPAIGSFFGYTRDISDGGAQVFIENEQVPPTGTVLNVMFKKASGPVNETPVPMRVMHAKKQVIGLMFTTL